MYFHFRSFTEFINVDNLLRITAIILLQMSEPSDEHAAMQQYLVCGTENCLKNAQFYCNDCHRPLCEQCSDEHKKSTNTKKHEIVLYRHRKYQLPVEMCQNHPTNNLNIF